MSSVFFPFNFNKCYSRTIKIKIDDINEYHNSEPLNETIVYTLIYTPIKLLIKW